MCCKTIFAARENNTDSICHSIIAGSLIDVEFCRDLKILQSRVHNLNIEMSADRFKSVWESLISILLDGNTEAAFSAELVTAISTEIGMGFVPISICWHPMNNNLIPGVALRAVLFKGAGNFVWIVAHALHCLLLSLLKTSPTTGTVVVSAQ